MKLTIIGCTGSFAGPNSPASCYLVSGEDAEGRTWRILLDMGNGALGVLQRHIDLHDIDAVLVSHLHPDHCIDLAGLHVAIKWDPRGWGRPPIPLWAPTGLHEYLSSTHGLPTEPGMHGEFDFHTWVPEEPVRVGPFAITPFRVEHPTPEPYALRIDYDGVMGPSTLAYSGDTDACEGLVRAARDADVFLCEAAYHEGRDDALRGIHLTGRRAAEDYTVNRYHKPGDEYDPNWDWSGALRDLSIYYLIGRQLAESSAWPNWRPGDEFRAIRDRSRAGQ